MYPLKLKPKVHTSVPTIETIFINILRFQT